MNPCLPHPVGASSSLTYTLSGLTEAQLVNGVNVSILGATVDIDSTSVNGATITDTSGMPIENVSIAATGIFTF